MEEEHKASQHLDVFANLKASLAALFLNVTKD